MVLPLKAELKKLIKMRSVIICSIAIIVLLIIIIYQKVGNQNSGYYVDAHILSAQYTISFNLLYFIALSFIFNTIVGAQLSGIEYTSNMDGKSLLIYGRQKIILFKLFAIFIFQITAIIFLILISIIISIFVNKQFILDINSKILFKQIFIVLLFSYLDALFSYSVVTLVRKTNIGVIVGILFPTLLNYFSAYITIMKKYSINNFKIALIRYAFLNIEKDNQIQIASLGINLDVNLCILSIIFLIIILIFFNFIINKYRNINC